MNDAKRAGENAESKPFNLRLPHPVAAQLDALAASLPIVSKHRLAVEALRLGIAALVADPSILLRGATTPSTSAPATPGAPAPSRPVAAPVVPVEASPATPGIEALAAEVARARALPAMLAAEDRAAPAVDPRQLPLLSPVVPVAAPPVAPVAHTSTSGASITTVPGNDNGAAPAQPKPVEAPLPDIDLDALKVRVRAAIAAKHSERSICTAAGLSESALNAWLNRPGRGLRQETARKVDPVLRGLRF